MGEEGRLNSRGLLKAGVPPLRNPSVSPLEKGRERIRVPLLLRKKGRNEP